MDLNSILGGTTKKNGNSRPINIEQNEIGNTTAKDTPKRQPTQTKPVKRGEYSSSVSTSNPTYNYEYGNNVEFFCERIDNQSDETTGTLSVVCWVSEKRRDNNEWANDNVLFVGKYELGVLDKNYGFPDVSYNFEFDEETSEFIDKLFEEGNEWHFVFTINELHEDGNNYIIHTINGPNEIDGLDEQDPPIGNNISSNNSSSYNEDFSVSSRVKAIVAEKLNVNSYKVVESASFINDLGADSLDAVELIMEFEKEFGINIPDDQAERIRTVGDAIRYIENNY